MKLNILKIILLLILFTSCKKNIDFSKANVVINAEETCKEQIVSDTGYFLVIPDNVEIDSLKNVMGDSFFTVADDSNYYIGEINGLLKNTLQKINADCINFKNEKYVLKKKHEKLNWYIIDYKKGEIPKIISLVDFYLQISQKEPFTDNKSSNQIIDQLNKSNTLNAYIFDVNGDGKDDKIFSNKPNTGDSLLIFFQVDDKFKLVLETTNFSQDGGHQFSTIKKNGNGFSIKTDFPDGTDEYLYGISYLENKFILNKVTHYMQSWQNKKAEQCNFNTNINLKNSKDEIWKSLVNYEDRANCFNK